MTMWKKNKSLPPLPEAEDSLPRFLPINQIGVIKGNNKEVTKIKQNTIAHTNIFKLDDDGELIGIFNLTSSHKLLKRSYTSYPTELLNNLVHNLSYVIEARFENPLCNKKKQAQRHQKLIKEREDKFEQYISEGLEKFGLSPDTKHYKKFINHYKKQIRRKKKFLKIQFKGLKTKTERQVEIQKAILENNLICTFRDFTYIDNKTKLYAYISYLLGDLELEKGTQEQIFEGIKKRHRYFDEESHFQQSLLSVGN